MSNDFQILTRFNKHLIEQEVVFPKGMDLIQEVTKKIIKLQDDDVKNALIAMGWTPPESSGIRLSCPFSVSLMTEIIDKLRFHSDMELSHISLSGRATQDWEIQAHFKGNGLYPARYIVLHNVPSENRASAEIYAKDLNTLFGLSVPEKLANT